MLRCKMLIDSGTEIYLFVIRTDKKPVMNRREAIIISRASYRLGQLSGCR